MGGTIMRLWTDRWINLDHFFFLLLYEISKCELDLKVKPRDGDDAE